MRNQVYKTLYGPMILNTKDIGVCAYIIRDGYWAMDTIAITKSLLNLQLAKSDRVVFYDLGANVGAYSLALSKEYGSNIFIRAFEAQRQIYNMLCGTMALNEISNVYCYNNAISEFNGQMLQLQLPDYDTNNNFGGFEVMPPNHSDNHDMIKKGSELVETITVDSFDEKVDFLKIDIEGMEDRAIRGAVKTIEKYRPIIIAETFKTDSNFISKYFSNKSYRSFLRPNTDLILIPEEYNVSIDAQGNIK